MFRKYFFILILLLTACETVNHLAVIEVSEGRIIIVNGKYATVEDLTDAISDLAQAKKLDSNQIKNSKVKVEFSSNVKVGIVNDVKEQLEKTRIQNIEYYIIDKSKRSKYIQE